MEETSNTSGSSPASKPKGILKRASQSSLASEASPPAPHQSSPEHHLKWDEANIIWTEANRTATMKIDEPKTPFVRAEELPPDDADSEEALPTLLKMTLEGDNGAAGSASRFSISSSAMSCSDHSDWNAASAMNIDDGEEEVDPAAAQRRHEEFERKRMEHYNMKEALRKAREMLETEEAAAGEGD